MPTAQEAPRLSRSMFDLRSLTWMDRAACRGEDLTLFFGPSTGEDREHPLEKRDREDIAKWYCAGCPVRTDCLEYAVSQGEKYGIWGGMDGDQRKRFHRARIARERKARKGAAA